MRWFIIRNLKVCNSAVGAPASPGSLLGILPLSTNGTSLVRNLYYEFPQRLGEWGWAKINVLFKTYAVL